MQSRRWQGGLDPVKADKHCASYGRKQHKQRHGKGERLDGSLGAVKGVRKEVTLDVRCNSECP